MLKHIAYREGLHLVAGCVFYLAILKLWPVAWVNAGVVAALWLLFIVSVREVWDLRTLKRAAVRVALARERDGDTEFITGNPWWKSWVDVAGWFAGVLLAMWLT